MNLKNPLIFLILTTCYFTLLVPQSHAALTDGLVGHWTFDGKHTNWATGKTSDMSGQGSTGQMINMSTSTSPVVGNLGQGLRFDGANDAVVGSSSAIDTGTQFTVAMWAYRKTFNAIFFSTINDDGGGNGPYTGGGFNFDNDAWNGTSKLRFVADCDGGDLIVASQSVLRSNVWTHIAVKWDGTCSSSGVKFYFNGIQENATVLTGTPGGSYTSSASTYRIGRSGAVTIRYLGGILDDVRLYNRALAATEVAQLYKVGAAKFGVSPSVGTGQAGLSAGLVGHWTFDGKDTNWATGRTSDLSGQGNTGQMISMSTSTSPVAGKLGQGLKFDGGNDIVNVGAGSSLNVGTTFSVSVWIKPSMSGTSRYGIFTTRTANAVGSWQVEFGNSTCNGSGNNSIAVTGPSVFLACTGAGAITPFQWNHVVITKNGAGDTALIYVNGAPATLVTTTTYTPANNADAKHIGDGTSGGQFFPGTLDDVRVYNRALTATEIRQLYSVGATKLGVSPSAGTGQTGLSSGLVGHWTFDGKDFIQNIKDVSGSGNHLFIIGGLATSSIVTTGKIGQALDSRPTVAATKYAGSVSSSLNPTTAISFGTWFKDPGNNNQLPIFSTRNSFGGYQFVLKDIGTGSAIGVYARVSTTTADAAVGSATLQAFYNLNPYPLASWHYLFATYDSATGLLSLYFDGVLKTTYQGKVGASIAYDASSGLWIGIGPGGGTGAEGFLDDMRIYSRALSATEVQQLYKTGQAIRR